MSPDIRSYHERQLPQDAEICNTLYSIITSNLIHAESKVWHAHPVWFLEGNPIVGYSKLKDGIRLLFWSGASFEEENLHPIGSFKSAEIRYTSLEQIDSQKLKRCLEKAIAIQWDYKNIVKRKGVLLRLK